MTQKGRWICHPCDGDGNYLVPVFRKRFRVKNGLQKATLFITAHGIYEAELNGQPVTDQRFTPGLTSYYYRIQVQTYDVIALLHEGENLWQTTVGDGWWRWNNNFGYRLALWGVLELTYADGKSEVVPTDESFEVSTGSVVKSDLQKGETYDAQIAPENWTEAILETDHTDADLIPQQGVPVREKERFSGKLFRDSAGDLVADFGQNIAGYIHMVLHNTEPGQVIHLKHGEGLDQDGKFSTANCDGGMAEFQEITYICKGAEREEYRPHFACFGFRYALIEGIDNGEFTAIAVYSDMGETGDFRCSNEMINKLVENARWSQKGNFLDVPVDCPTRERNAWTGDAQIYVNTAAYFMDVQQFFTKWLADQRIEQYASGKVGITFPSTSSVHNPEELKQVQEKRPEMALAGPTGDGHIGEDSVGWGDSAVWLPYQLYLMYGDKQILAAHYETAKRWLEFSLSCMREINPRYADRDYYRNGDGDYIYDTRFHYGEWNEPLPPAPEVIELFMKGGTAADYVTHMAQYGKPEVATAYTSYVLTLLAEIEESLGFGQKANEYRKFADNCKNSYRALLETPEYSLDTDRQARLVRPLALNMLSKQQEEYAQNRLVQALDNYGWRIGTGFLSTPFILDVLKEIDPEYAYRLLENEEMPGWLFMPKNGATTVWEAWEGTESKNGGIGSLNHYSKGAVCRFLFETVCGIKVTGKNDFAISPVPGGSLTFAGASYTSVYGKVECSWKKTHDKTVYSVTVPSGCRAKVILPNGKITMQEAGTEQYEI